MLLSRLTIRSVGGSANLRLAVVSPFLDRRHGTERCVVEQIERLARFHDWQIHVYCQRIEQLDCFREDGEVRTPGKDLPGIFWHKIREFPGPHLFQYLCWFAANYYRRWRDFRSGNFRPDIVYSPGINCFDADAIAVHITFHSFYRRVRQELRFRKLPLRMWPLSIHRRLYYRLIMALEKRIYRNGEVSLAAVSRLTAEALHSDFGREDVKIIHNAVDADKFSPQARAGKRAAAREKFGFGDGELVLLLIGNDWKKKGLDCLLDAMAMEIDLPLRLLLVGQDDPSLYLSRIARLGLEGKVVISKPSEDVLSFYAAADIYTGPSIDDAFGLPVIEAMACGMVAITSAHSGVAELITDSIDGFILKDSFDHGTLATLLRRLYEKPALRARIGENAGQTARQYTWDRNASQTKEFLEAALERKRSRS